MAVLDNHQHGPAPFAADAEALNKSQNDQEHRRGHAHLVVRGQDTNQKRRESHQRQRGDQHGFSAHAIAEVPEHDAADRASEESDRVRPKRGHRADEGIERGKEEPIENEGGGRPVEKEVVPFDRRADEAGSNNADYRDGGSGGIGSSSGMRRL